MRKRTRLGAVAALALGLGLVAGTAAAEDDPYAKAGENLYHQHCGACHGITAQGDGPVAPLLDPRPPDLTRIAARRDGTFPESAILRIIDGRDPVVAHGTREMPVWGQRFAEGPPPGPGARSLARGQVMLLVHYLKSIQHTP